MGKKSKDPAAAPKKEAKPKQQKTKAPPDPVKTNNLIRLLNILALLLAIIAFLLQLFAVLSYHWKWQKVDLGSLLSRHQTQSNVHEDGVLYQNFGLYSREVKVYANNDEHLDVIGSTQFPRNDEGDEQLHQCLSQTTTLRGAFLACSKRVSSPKPCHCRRHPYWNAVIFFEIFALIFLGIVVFLTAMLSTQFHGLLKLIASALALLAFLFLLVGLILILSYLKRETNSFADAFPHIHRRLVHKLQTQHETRRSVDREPTALHQVVRRQVKEFYRLYQLSPGQYPHNDTHFREFSQDTSEWVYRPLSSLDPSVPHVPHSLQDHDNSQVDPSTTTISAPLFNAYGPIVGYQEVFDHTLAGIGWSTVLSIIAMILALLIPLLLIYSWLQNKNLSVDTKKNPVTSVETAYVAVPQEIPLETIETIKTIEPIKPLPTGFDPQHPIGEAVVAAQNVGPYDQFPMPVEPTIVKNVVIPGTNTVEEAVVAHTFPVTVEQEQRA